MPHVEGYENGGGGRRGAKDQHDGFGLAGKCKMWMVIQYTQQLY